MADNTRAHALIVLLLFFDLLMQEGQKMFVILLIYMFGCTIDNTSFRVLITKCV